MSHWNYRVVKTTYGDEDSYAIHEVYYNNAGNPRSMTRDPVGFCGDTHDGLIRMLEMALKDAKERAVFEPPAKWDKEVVFVAGSTAITPKP